jgi:hypothetical protein
VTPDVVIPVREGARNEQLRFTLRAIAANFPARVLLIGGRPDWAHLERLPSVQGDDGYTNQVRAMRIACLSDQVSDPFVWWCDDTYLLHPLAEVPRLARSDWATATGEWASRMHRARKTLEQRGLPTLNYELHIPMLIDKATMLAALDIGQDMRTVYGNLAGYAIAEVPDVKLRRISDPWPEGATFVSTNNATFRKHRARIEALFPDPSPAESHGR